MKELSVEWRTWRPVVDLRAKPFCLHSNRSLIAGPHVRIGNMRRPAGATSSAVSTSHSRACATGRGRCIHSPRQLKLLHGSRAQLEGSEAQLPTNGATSAALARTIGHHAERMNRSPSLEHTNRISPACHAIVWFIFEALGPVMGRTTLFYIQCWHSSPVLEISDFRRID